MMKEEDMETGIEKACIEVDVTISDFLDDYEYDDGELCCHTPTETEDILIRDAVSGLIADDKFIRQFVDWRLLVETGKRLDSVKQALNNANALAVSVMTDSVSDDSHALFIAAIRDIAAINEALGCDPDDGGAVPIIEAIEELKNRIAELEKEFNFRSHLKNQREFSEKTFGPGARAEGVVDHITKELAEILAQPDDLEEWIDVVILALDGAWRAGYSPDQIIEKLVAKQKKNESRKWPDWRTAEPGKAIEHID